MHSSEVAAHMPEGLNVVASRHLEMADGKFPIAWVDTEGNMLPVEKYSLLSILPAGCRYLFDADDIRDASRTRVYTGAQTITDPQVIGHATGETPTPPADLKPEVSRAQALSAFNSVLGSPTHQVR
jgi:hypothetical protein